VREWKVCTELILKVIWFEIKSKKVETDVDMTGLLQWAEDINLYRRTSCLE